MKVTVLFLSVLCLLVTGSSQAQAPLSVTSSARIKGRVVSENGDPLSLASVVMTPGDIRTFTAADGSFVLALPGRLLSSAVVLHVSYVGKQAVDREIDSVMADKSILFVLKDNNLKLPEVEINGIRKRTSASNSSIAFDREAIEQTQALSIANVLDYLPGQTILKPVVSVQGLQALTMRSALPPNSVDALNNAFGISVQVDGATLSNDANMQAMNPGRMGFFSSNNIQNPENAIQDRSYRNGTLYRSYSTVSEANNGIDLRQMPAENIEKIEVVSGVASARYGDYTTGLVLVDRQAGVTPWRINARTNEASQNLGLNKGVKLDNGLGAVNVSLDYLHSNDDPRNNLKSYQRVAGSLLWTYQENRNFRFKNTLSVDANTTLDQTKQDPDLGSENSSRFSNRRVNISNRSSWTLKKPWLYDIQLQGSYSIGRQESYDQWYLNTTTIKGITDAMITGIFEGNYVPGYYLAVKHIIGEPVNASGRLETSSLFRLKKASMYKLVLGVDYSYSANKGPGMLIDPDRPRFAGTGYKNDRPRSFKQTPVLSNTGFYAENIFTTKIFDRPFTANLGARGDWQNGFFTFSPRASYNYSITRRLAWNTAYGVATKAPSLSQISPGNVYIDVPLINAYNGSVDQSLYLVYTRVIDLNKLDIRPYRSNTFETGITYDARPFHFSAYFFNRVYNNGFTAQTVLLPLDLPNYTLVNTPGQKPLYTPDGTTTRYNVTYGKVTNGVYNSTNGAELIISTDKIRVLQTSFSLNTSYYHTYSQNSTTTVNIPDNPRYDLQAVYGVFRNAATTADNIKSTFVSTTHIPALRMAVMLTAELFWMNRNLLHPSALYPIGYYDKDMNYYPLTAEQARSPEYAHLVKSPESGTNPLTRTPAFVYTNVHLRLSKEIGDYLRFSFNAYNVFNIRPAETTLTGTAYYNGQPAYGAELIFTLK